MRVVVCNPAVQCPHECHGTGPLRPPAACCCACTPHPRGVRVARGVVLAGEGLRHPHGTAGFHERPRGWWAAVVTHPGQALLPSARRPLAVHGHRPGCQPRPGGARRASVVATDRLGRPIQPHDDRDPPEVLSPELGPVDAPPCMGRGRAGCAACRRAFGPARPLGLDQHGRLPQQAPHPLLMDGALLDTTQGGPEAALAPERRRGWARRNPLAQACRTRGDAGRRVAAHPSHASRLCHSRVRSPTRVLHRVVSRTTRASCGAS
jgi:hypothetical protein